MMRRRRRSWEATCSKLERICFRLGVDSVADRIHADRATVYRLIGKQTKRPTLSLMVNVEALVDARPTKEPEQDPNQ